MIVATSENKSGATIYGNIAATVVVQVDRTAPYAPDPTGTCICVFKGNVGRLTVAANCKGKLPIWVIDEKSAPAAGAIAGTTVSADGFVFGGSLYKLDGSTCVELDCSGSGFTMSTCVNSIACLLGKKEPYTVPWGTFGGPPKEPATGAPPPVAK